MIADHMFKEQASLSYSGTFSLNGSPNTLFDGVRPTLLEFQDLFMHLKDAGCECYLSKVVYGSNDARFQKRGPCVINNIKFVENINSLSFAFDFVELLTYELEEFEDVEEISDDLPQITTPVERSFSSILIDWNEVDSLIVKVCKDMNLISDDFWTELSNRADLLIASGTLIVGASVGLGVMAAGVVAASAIPVVGAIIGIGAGAYFLYKAIRSSVESAKAKKTYRIEQFKKYEDDAKMAREIERFCNFTSEVRAQLEIFLKNNFYIYQFPLGEEQDCFININSQVYTCECRKDNTQNGAMTLSIYQELVMTDNTCRKLLVTPFNILSAPQTYSDCSSNNALFRVAETGEYVHLLHLPQTNKASDLTDYYIVVSSKRPEDLVANLEKVISATFLY